jgi:hypothetical protein
MVVHEATLGDVLAMSPKLRPEDAREIEASSCLTAHDGLELSWRLSEQCYVIRPTEDAEPVAIFGVRADDMNPDMGIVWMLATTDVGRYALGVIAVSKRALDYFLTLYPRGLHNLADARNTLHLRWCELMGFIKLAKKEIRGQDFIHIYYGSEQKCVDSLLA